MKVFGSVDEKGKFFEPLMKDIFGVNGKVISLVIERNLSREPTRKFECLNMKVFNLDDTKFIWGANTKDIISPTSGHWTTF